MFRSSLPLYASAVSISNLLNVIATTGGEVVRGGDGGAPELEEERVGALRPRHLPAAQVAWLPSHSRSPDSTLSHRLILGTHTSNETPKHLLLADAALPLPPRLAAGATVAGGAVPASSVSISRSVPHKGEINRARYMPQRRYMVATKTCVDEVHVYHLGDDGEKGGADVVLRGHEAEGYGLAPAQSTAPFQVSIFTSRSTTAADVPTRRSAASPSHGFAATLTKMMKGEREREREREREIDEEGREEGKEGKKADVDT
uniref:Histone-binding protein RBBP4-like N-terminal domain-containing protein n=1 Tax=Oryza glumipatula TaxID=40148 RepID=A0A0D9ZYW4_9ORYZ